MQARMASTSASKEALRGQLGQQLRQFNEVSGHLQKLRGHFDQIMAGQLSVTEMYGKAVDTELLSSSGKGFTPRKQARTESEDHQMNSNI